MGVSQYTCILFRKVHKLIDSEDGYFDIPIFYFVCSLYFCGRCFIADKLTAWHITFYKGIDLMLSGFN